MSQYVFFMNTLVCTLNKHFLYSDLLVFFLFFFVKVLRGYMFTNINIVVLNQCFQICAGCCSHHHTHPPKSSQPTLMEPLLQAVVLDLTTVTVELVNTAAEQQERVLQKFVMWYEAAGKVDHWLWERKFNIYCIWIVEAYWMTWQDYERNEINLRKIVRSRR